MRQGRSGIRGSFVQVESRMSQTGANADEWVPARPGTEGVLALGLAHVIMREKLASGQRRRPRRRADRGLERGLADYSPEQVEKITGVSARRVERLAREFAERRPAVAIIGGAPLAHTNGLFSALAVNALNALVGNVGEARRHLLHAAAQHRPSARGRIQTRTRRPLAELGAGVAPTSARRRCC